MHFTMRNARFPGTGFLVEDFCDFFWCALTADIGSNTLH